MYATGRTVLSLLAAALLVVACSGSTTVIAPTGESASALAPPTPVTPTPVTPTPAPSTRAPGTTASEQPSGRELLELLQAEQELECYGDGSQPEIVLDPTSDMATTELVDVRTTTVTTIGAAVTGDRPILIWYWDACSKTSQGQYAEIERFAVLHQDDLQVIGLGSNGGLPGASRLLTAAPTQAVPLLWDGDGHARTLLTDNRNYQGVIQLLSFDLQHQSHAIFFNDVGREIVLTAMAESPWAPG